MAKQACARCRFSKPENLCARRSVPRKELQRIGHRSVETTERYLGSRQRIVHAVKDKLGIEPDATPG
jgi:hypothetical protein